MRIHGAFRSAALHFSDQQRRPSGSSLRRKMCVGPALHTFPGRVSSMVSIPNLKRRLAQSLGIAVAAVVMMSAAQRAQALSPVSPATSPIAKAASGAPITEVHGHGGGGGGGHGG